MRKLLWTSAAFVAAAAIAASLQGSAIASETITYSYDSLGRLVQVRHSGTVNNGELATYSYDQTDNRNTVTVTGK